MYAYERRGVCVCGCVGVGVWGCMGVYSYIHLYIVIYIYVCVWCVVCFVDM